MTGTLLSRLDPASVHPARLAGRHAWASWGLADPAPDWGDIRLLVRHADAACVDIVADSIRDQLGRADWPPSPLLRVSGTRTVMQVTDGESTGTIEITTRPWYAGPGQPPLPAAVVDRNGWPVLDEFSALRDRLESIARDGIDRDCVEGLASWVARKGMQAHVSARAATPLGLLLHRLRQDAPEAYQTLIDVEKRARQVSGTLRGAAVRPAFRYLAETRHREERRRTGLSR